MNSSKTRSSLPEASHNKTSPATPKVNKVNRNVAKSDTDSPSPLQNSRITVDRSPKTADSKPTIVHRSPKPKIATPDKPRVVLKGSELQAQLDLVQEDLKKSKERLASAENEKARVLEELEAAKRLADEANEKLREALLAQKRAEDNSEIEKFRADELEQAGIEAAQKQAEDWQKELEAVRNQHAVDVAALLSATQELQRVKQELAMTSDAKNQALSHADDATKIAEIHAEKVELLSAELSRVKAMLDAKSEREANETTELIMKLKTEVDLLKEDLKKAQSIEQKLVETEALVDQLRIELEAAKNAELAAINLVEEWQKKAGDLETQVEEAKQMERSASESVDSLMNQLEGKSGELHDAESEIAFLKEKVGSLEISLGQQRKDFEESEQHLETAKQDALEMAQMVESLKAKLETLTEEKKKALNNEQLAASSVQNLLAEKNKLINELETSREEEEKSKKALESLASALHEVSAEARETKEKLLSNEAELENSKTQLEDLRLVVKEANEKLLSNETELENSATQIEDLKLLVNATNQKCETMLEESKQEIDLLTKALDYSNHEVKNSKVQWEQKEHNLMTSLRKSEEETYAAKREIDRLIRLLKEAEDEARSAKEEEAQILSTIKQTESELNSLKEVVEEAKAESMRLSERLSDKENELQSITQENKDLQARETTALEKVDELSKLLEEAHAKKIPVENGELSDSEKDYDLLPKVVEFSEENGNGGSEEKHVFEFPTLQLEELKEDKDQERDLEVPVESKMENGNDSPKEENGDPQHVNGDAQKEGKKVEEDESVKVEVKMWENCKIGEKDLSPEKEPEQESVEEDLDSKADGENFDQVNGLPASKSLNNEGRSPSKEQQQKKKKPLLKKFGNLLKKATASGNK